LWLLVVREVITVLIFSKDRALHLDACLSSFFRHAQDATSASLNVLFDASSERLKSQYNELVAEYADRAQLFAQNDFKSSVLQVLRFPPEGGAASAGYPSIGTGATVRRQGRRYVLLLVDDTVFVRPFSLLAVQTALERRPKTLGFSLRLGKNTTRSYAFNRTQTTPAFEDVGGDMLEYDWTRADGDFSYPLELSSSVYRLSAIRPLIASLEFNDPNSLESRLANSVRQFARQHPFLLCFERSVAFSTPLNRVQDVFDNRVSANPEWSTARLADRFDQGERIKVSLLDGFVPSACHEEITLTFEGGSEVHAED
jgi:hypothetical protein